eukprot:gene11072-3778_t
MKIVFVALCLFFASIYAKEYHGIIPSKNSNPGDFKLCMENPPFLPKSIEIKPDVIRRNEKITITTIGEGRTANPTNGGKLTNDVYLRGVRVFQYIYDLCEITVGGCPIKPGTITQVIEQQVPRLAFPGNYTSRSIAVDDQGNQLTCVEKGVLMHNVGGWLKIAQFRHWSQVIYNYVGFIAPLAFLVKDFDFFHQYCYSVVSISIIEIYGYATDNSFIYPNNILDKVFGIRNFALLMTVALPIMVPIGNCICRKLNEITHFDVEI